MHRGASRRGTCRRMRIRSISVLHTLSCCRWRSSRRRHSRRDVSHLGQIGDSSPARPESLPIDESARRATPPSHAQSSHASERTASTGTTRSSLALIYPSAAAGSLCTSTGNRRGTVTKAHAHPTSATSTPTYTNGTVYCLEPAPAARMLPRAAHTRESPAIHIDDTRDVATQRPHPIVRMADATSTARRLAR